MNVERSVLVAFLGNYLINTVIAALVALVPVTAGATGIFTPQYMVFVGLAALLVAVLTWWYMKGAPRGLTGGLIFGVIGFVVAIATAFVTGIAGVLAQTGSFSAVIGVLPNFVPFIWNVTTLFLLGYWVLPAALMGWLMRPKAMPMPASSTL